MGITFLILLGLVSCNPYQPYNFTHYHMIAEVDPEADKLDANLQMVFVAHSDYYDSIVFWLNEGFEISNLTAQGLKHYEFKEGGRLVLYNQNPVIKGDQLHISLSYSGKPGLNFDPEKLSMSLDSSLYWYPWNGDIQTMTYNFSLELPDGYEIAQGFGHFLAFDC